MLKEQILNFYEEITSKIYWVHISKEEAEVLDDSGSFIYAAFNGEQCLYVGESGSSLKARFKIDGTSHYYKDWYKDVTEVRYCRWEPDELGLIERKLLEQAVSLIYKPQHYGKIGRPKKK
jgi:hypothetical protein